MQYRAKLEASEQDSEGAAAVGAALEDTHAQGAKAGVECCVMHVVLPHAVGLGEEGGEERGSSEEPTSDEDEDDKRKSQEEEEDGEEEEEGEGEEEGEEKGLEV